MIVPLYGMLELTVPASKEAQNPYDPVEISVEARLIDPEGVERMHPAFWDGEGWRWRFRPGGIGTWEAIFQENGREIDSISFDVVDEGNAGPVTTDGLGFREVDGSAWLPVGLNLGWAPWDQQDLYAEWFADMSAQGGNSARVWLAGFAGQAPEWGVLGVYDPEASEKIDRILDLASEHGVRVLLVLWQHSQLQASMWSSWDANPYNEANGGPCADSTCFFVDPTALEYQRDFLRYVVARWAAHPALLGWEVMNELDAVTGVETSTAHAWAADRADELRAMDPLHPVTWSFSMAVWYGSDDWRGADFTQLHAYLLADVEPVVDGVGRLLDEGGPVLVGEWGLDFLGRSDAMDVEGRAWHNANWAALASGAAGNAWTWWWDNHIDPKDLWFRLAGPASLETLDLPSMTPLGVYCGELRCLGRGNDLDALIWFQDAEVSYEDAEAPTVEDASFLVPGTETVEIHFLDTSTGELVATAWGQGGQLASIPAFSRDIAATLHFGSGRTEAEGCACAATGTRGGGSWLGVGGLLWGSRRRRGRKGWPPAT
jgi:hypothetical protein